MSDVTHLSEVVRDDKLEIAESVQNVCGDLRDAQKYPKYRPDFPLPTGRNSHGELGERSCRSHELCTTRNYIPIDKRLHSVYGPRDDRTFHALHGRMLKHSLHSFDDE